MRRAGTWMSGLLMALVLCAGAAPAAVAQCRNVWAPSAEGGQLILICGPARAPALAPKRTQRRKSPRATRQQLRELRFRASAAVSAKVRAALVERLAHGDQAGAIRAQIESGDLLAQARRDLTGSFGWSPHDLADAYAQALIVMWLIHSGTERTSARTDRAVREDVHQRLARDTRTRTAVDARQQAYAETLMSWTTVIAGTYNQYRKTADADGLARWRERTRELAEEPALLGIDLADIRLDRHGIRKR